MPAPPQPNVVPKAPDKSSALNEVAPKSKETTDLALKFEDIKRKNPHLIGFLSNLKEDEINKLIQKFSTEDTAQIKWIIEYIKKSETREALLSALSIQQSEDISKALTILNHASEYYSDSFKRIAYNFGPEELKLFRLLLLQDKDIFKNPIKLLPEERKQLENSKQLAIRLIDEFEKFDDPNKWSTEHTEGIAQKMLLEMGTAPDKITLRGNEFFGNMRFDQSYIPISLFSAEKNSFEKLEDYQPIYLAYGTFEKNLNFKPTAEQISRLTPAQKLIYDMLPQFEHAELPKAMPKEGEFIERLFNTYYDRYPLVNNGPHIVVKELLAKVYNILAAEKIELTPQSPLDFLNGIRETLTKNPESRSLS